MADLVSTSTTTQWRLETRVGPYDDWKQYCVYPNDMKDSAEKEYVRLLQIPGKHARLARQVVTMITEIQGEF
jgi:hypothetical protein